MGEDLYKHIDLNIAYSVIFCNLEDYPIHTFSRANLEPIHANLESALRKMSCIDDTKVMVALFGDSRPGQFEKAKHTFYVPESEEGINPFLPNEVGENAADWNMALEIVIWARSHVGLNIFVLAKQKPESEVYRVLEVVSKYKKFDIFLLKPTSDSTTAEELFQSVESIVASTHVFEPVPSSDLDHLF